MIDVRGGSNRRRRPAGSGIVLGAAAVALMVPSTARALERNKAGWYHTGDAVITKNMLVFDVDVLAVGHDMKCLPEHRSATDVVEAGCDKRFTWRMLRDVDRETIRESLAKAYRDVDYGDGAKVRRAISAFTSDLKEGGRVTITYDAAKQVTTFQPQSGSRVDVPGEPFMHATWRTLFANADARKIGTALMSKL